jgi:hypothetical protein
MFNITGLTAYRSLTSIEDQSDCSRKSEYTNVRGRSLANSSFIAEMNDCKGL